MPGSGVVLDVTYEYDLADRRTGIVNELTQVQLVDLGFVDGLPVSTEYGNGLVRQYVFDDLGKPTSATTTNSLSQVVESTTLDYTLELSPPREQTRATTTTPLVTTVEEYWFAEGASFSVPEQLVGKRVFGWNHGGGSSKTFAWDELSNMVSNGAGDSFAYNSERNRLLSATLAHEGETVTYTYDEAGFVTSRDGVTLSWTASGKLASYGSAMLQWDALGRLISYSMGGLTKDFLLFGGRVESNLVSLGAIDLGEVSIQLVSGETEYRHFDFRGNVSFVSDDAEAIINHYRYSPYGVDTVFGPGMGKTAFEARPGFGPFVFMGARMFDPLVGRFLQPDPIIQPTNQFAYTLGNPIQFGDRDGREMDATTKFAIVGAGLVFLGAVILTVGATVGASAAALAVTSGSGTASAALAAIVNAAGANIVLIGSAVGLAAALGSPGGGKPGEAPPPRWSPPPPPAPPGPRPGDSEGEKQRKELVLTVEELPSCSPTALGRVPDTGAALPFLLLLNLLVGVVWWWRRKEEGTRCS